MIYMYIYVYCMFEPCIATKKTSTNARPAFGCCDYSTVFAPVFAPRTALLPIWPCNGSTAGCHPHRLYHDTGFYGFLWVSMGFYGFLWVSMSFSMFNIHIF